MNSSRRTALGLEKRERTRAALIEATYQVVAQKVAESVTIDDIIATAGVARGTFYNYFQSRDEALLALAIALRDGMQQRMSRQPMELDDPAERLAIAVRQLLHRAIQDPTWGWVVFRIGLAINPFSELMEQGMFSNLETGKHLNRLQIDDVQAALTLTRGTGWMALRNILSKKTAPDYPEQIAKIILKSLGIADAEADAIAFKSLDPSQNQGKR
jgi:AcrR family transcriptional regulator